MQASRPQSHLRFPLTHLLASGGHVRVLRALLAFGGALSVAQIAADAGLSPRGTRIVLDSLASQGIVTVLGQARTQLYCVDMAHPLAGTLSALFGQERQRWEDVQNGLREAIASWAAVRSAWLYGSVARGEDVPRSDVDLALVTQADGVDASAQVRDAAQALGEKLRLPLSVVVLSPAELAALHADDPWWTQLQRDAKVLKGLSPAREAARCRRQGAPA